VRLSLFESRSASAEAAFLLGYRSLSRSI